MKEIPHIPVLLDNVIKCFQEIKNGYIIDCTTGFGGHSEAILTSNPFVKLICNDQDEIALNFTKKRLATFQDRVIFTHSNFKNIIDKYKDYPIRGILADIGVSSLHLDDKNRGFSFNSDTLDMRMDKTQLLDAYQVVNNYSFAKLQFILQEYGEIKNAKEIASKIIQNRPIYSAKELANLFVHNKKQKIHPATLIFQAIRIEVNQELEVLKQLFDSIEKHIHNATIAIISFHSLEDRIVKNYFKKWANKCICPTNAIKCVCGNNNAIGQIITKKPIIPTKKEIQYNPRSRSSKMRIFKID